MLTTCSYPVVYYRVVLSSAGSSTQSIAANTGNGSFANQASNTGNGSFVNQASNTGNGSFVNQASNEQLVDKSLVSHSHCKI